MKKKFGIADYVRPIIEGAGLQEPTRIIEESYDIQLHEWFFKVQMYENNGSYSPRWFAQSALKRIPKNYEQMKADKENKKEQKSFNEMLKRHAKAIVPVIIAALVLVSCATNKNGCGSYDKWSAHTKYRINR